MLSLNLMGLLFGLFNVSPEFTLSWCYPISPGSLIPWWLVVCLLLSNRELWSFTTSSNKDNLLSCFSIKFQPDFSLECSDFMYFFLYFNGDFFLSGNLTYIFFFSIGLCSICNLYSPGSFILPRRFAFSTFSSVNSFSLMPYMPSPFLALFKLIYL